MNDLKTLEASDEMKRPEKCFQSPVIPFFHTEGFGL